MRVRAGTRVLRSIGGAAVGALAVACASGPSGAAPFPDGGASGDDGATGAIGDDAGPSTPAGDAGTPPTSVGADAGDAGDGGGTAGGDAAASDASAQHGGTDAAGTTAPFDPASCPGPSLTQAQAAQFFQPGATQAVIGSYTLSMRQRSCNGVTGCGAWSTPTTAVGVALGGGTQPLSGTILLNVQGSSVVLDLQDSTEEKPYSMGASCSAVDGSPQSCGAYEYDMGDQWGGSGGYFPTMAGLTDVDSNDVLLSGVLTAQCLRLAYAARDASGNDVQQFVLLAPVSPGPPLPPDPCPGGGSPMACGSQAAGQTTCCQKGLTTCPQSGCDCWAACQ